MKMLVGLVAGVASLLALPATWEARTEPVALLVLGGGLLCAGLLRRRHQSR
jgi:hypothetical protein